MINIMGIAYLTDKEASSRYGYSQSWFKLARRKRLKFKGPPYIQLGGKGKVYYSVSELDEWFKENMLKF